MFSQYLLITSALLTWSMEVGWWFIYTLNSPCVQMGLIMHQPRLGFLPGRLAPPPPLLQSATRRNEHVIFNTQVSPLRPCNCHRRSLKRGWEQGYSFWIPGTGSEVTWMTSLTCMMINCFLETRKLHANEAVHRNKVMYIKGGYSTAELLLPCVPHWGKKVFQKGGLEMHRPIAIGGGTACMEAHVVLPHNN